MTKSRFQWYLLPLVLLVGMLIGYISNIVISGNQNNHTSEKFNQVLKFAEENYFLPVDRDKLVEKAIIGMLDELDPHSIYLSPEEQVGISDLFKGNFDGIGIEFQLINDSITVVSAISGGPGESVGLLPGDRIIEINNESSIGLSNKDIVSQLRGEKGTIVNLRVFRPSMNQILDFTIIRDLIPLKTVDSAFMIDDSIGYVSLTKFVETSIYELKDALKKLSKKGMSKLVLDLRNNPGGYLDQAVKISDLFIDSDKLIVSTKGRKANFDDKYRAGDAYPYEKMPLAILVNRGSASASEIVTGAIQDWDRGIIVGETTFGKGLVQRPFTLSDNSAVRITISKYITPSGREIQRDYANKEEYFNVVYPNNHEDNDTVSTEEIDSIAQNYYSNNGRLLKGNGGITPDVIVHNSEISYYTTILRSNDLLFKYIRKYLDNNSSRLESKYGTDLQKFIDEFNFSNNDLNSFVKFAASNGVEFNITEFNQDKLYIKQRLKAYVARNYWNNLGWYKVLLNSDKQLLKAKELLSVKNDFLQK